VACFVGRRYHQIGWQQGHDPAANFDTKLYLVRNPDVAAAGIDPLQHYLQFGTAEGRQAYAAIGDTIVGGFDAEFYLRNNPDVAAAGVNPLEHSMAFGWKEGAIRQRASIGSAIWQRIRTSRPRRSIRSSTI
jgi:hypothetical protein